jgi:hypothetical protein
MHNMLSQYLRVISTIISPSKWVRPSMELALVQRSVILVVIIGLSSDDQVVDVSKVDLGWSLGLLVLEQGLGGDSPLLEAFSRHLNENQVIIVARILPSERICPSVELCLANCVVLVGLSQERGVVVELAEIWRLRPLDILVVLWLVLAVGVGLGLLSVILNLNSQRLFTPVFGHPVVNGCDWLSGSPVMLAVEMWMDILDLGVGVPGLLLEILGLGGSHVWLSGDWVGHGVRVLVEVELVHVDWATIWS